MEEKNIEQIKIEVIKKVRKEYKLFVAFCLNQGEWYMFENSLKITFYKEIVIYIQNAVLRDNWFLQMYEMDEILEELWNRYFRNEIVKSEKDFFLQLLDLHLNNIERLNDRDR